MKKLIPIIFILFLQACSPDQPKQENSVNTQSTDLVSLNDQQLLNTQLSIGKLEERTISTLIKVNGQVDVPPQNMVSVSIPLGGYLRYTSLLPGSHVNKGEVIAVMEDQQYIQMQQDYLTAKTKTALSRKEYLRQKELINSQAVSDKLFQQAEADYATQQITLSALAQKLSLININPSQLSAAKINKRINLYSPITGFVSKVNANIGKYLNPADVVFELVNPQDIHLNIKVFEKDLSSIAIGQKVMAFSNSQPEKKYECAVILVSKDLSSDHTADVHCHFEGFDKNLIPGMYMNAEIELRNSKVQTLPEEAIVNYQGEDYLFTALNKNQFKMVQVKSGRLENAYIEVLNPELLIGKSIVTKGAYTLLMKMKNKSDE